MEGINGFNLAKSLNIYPFLSKNSTIQLLAWRLWSHLITSSARTSTSAADPSR